jgi:hypothetical protein
MVRQLDKQSPFDIDAFAAVQSGTQFERNRLEASNMQLASFSALVDGAVH